MGSAYAFAQKPPAVFLSAITGRNIVGGRPVVSAAQAAGSLALLRNYTAQTGQVRHLITSACSDVRLVYSARSGGNGGANGVLPETDLANAVNIQAGVATSSTATTWYPVTFAGQRIGELAPGYATLMSDPIPLDLTAGSYLYERVHQTHAFGLATTLAAATLANATSFDVAAMPSGLVFPLNITVDTGANLEVVEVVGSSGVTFIINPNNTGGAARHKLALAHSLGAAVYQQLYTDRAVYADRGEFGPNYTTAPSTVPMRAYSGSFSALAAVATTLSAAANAGDLSVLLAALINAPTLLVGTGGTQESATAVNVVGTAAPYRYYLSAPLVNAQASGVACTSGTGMGYTGTAFGAKAVVADRTTGIRKPNVVVVGDSISAGSGYNLRYSTGFVELALGATHPVVNLSIGSDLASAFVAVANSVGRRKWLGTADWLFIEYPHNDISGSRTLAQIQADLATIITMGRNRGAKICLATQKPRTTSTDLWVTVANQTVDGFDAVRVAYNAWVRGGASGLADLIVDCGAPLDSGLAAGGAATGKWLAAHPTAGTYTSDGIHPNTIGHEAMATAINPALFV